MIELVWRVELDQDADLSWLDQTDAQMGVGFEESAAARKKAYARGEWEMVGVVVEAKWHGAILETTSLWGIESDSGPEYFETVARELVGELVALAVQRKQHD